MSRNRIRSANHLPTRGIVWAVGITSLVILGGLVYVVGWLNGGALANENKRLEQTLGEWEAKNKRFMVERQKLLTPESLEKRLAHFRVDMVPLNRLQVLDAQTFHRAETSVLARGNGRIAP